MVRAKISPGRRKTLLVAATALSLSASAFAVGPAPAEAAAAVPDVAKLAGPLAKQKLAWGACPGSLGQSATIQCAMVTVPQDWKNPKNGKTWQFRVSYNKLNDPSNPRFKGIIMGNPGGPGGAGLSMADYLAKAMPDAAPYYNFVGFNPRGIDKESRATCEYTVDESDPSPFAEVKAIGTACANNPEVKTITTEQTTYDMDLVRHLLGQKKLNYVGYSYGTWLGSWYSKVFGSKAGLMVLDSALDVTQPTYQHDKEFEPWAFPRQRELYDVPYETRMRTGDEAPAEPQSADRKIPAATASEDEQRDFLINQQGSESPLVKSAAASQLGKLKALKDTGVAAQPRAGQGAAVKKTLTDMSYMIRCNDGQYTQGENYWKAWTERVATELQDGQRPPELYYLPAVQCLSWRTQQLMPVANPKTYPKTIVIHGELDANTVWEHGSASGMKLPNTRFLAVDNYGTHGVFPLGTEEVDRPVINFFLTGQLPADRINVSQGPPRRGEDVTYEYWKPFDKNAQHYGELVTDPWQKAGVPTVIPTPAVTGAEIARKAQLETSFREWVSTRYGAQGLAVIDS